MSTWKFHGDWRKLREASAEIEKFMEIKDVIKVSGLSTLQEEQYSVKVMIGFRIKDTNLYIVHRSGWLVKIDRTALEEDPTYKETMLNQAIRAAMTTIEKAKEKTEYQRSISLEDITGREQDEEISIGTITFKIDGAFPIYPSGNIPNEYKDLTPFEPTIHNIIHQYQDNDPLWFSWRGFRN